jgi:hypothetical protein
MEKVAKNIAWIIATILLSIVFLSNIFFISKLNIYEIISINYHSTASMLVCMIVIIAITFLSEKIEKKHDKKAKKIFLIVLLAVYLIFQILWINTRQATPCHDQSYIYEAAKQFSQGDYNCGNKDYYEVYPHQLGLVTFFTMIFKVFNTVDVTLIQYINAVANTFTIYGIILISKIIEEKYKMNEVKTFLCALMFSTLPLLSTFIYGDIIALSFCIFAVYFIMRYGNSRNINYVLYSIICMAVACIVRKNSLIFSIAILIYIILCLLEEKKFNIKNVVQTITIIIIFLLVISVPEKLIEKYWQKKLNLDLSNKLPAEVYLSYGINESVRGPRMV